MTGKAMEDHALRESYAKAASLLAELLRMQELFIGSIVLVDQGVINARALGYIYGLADSALQIGGMDIGSPHGLGLLMSLLLEFDETNADRLWQYLKEPGDTQALIDGVSLGFEDYSIWAKFGSSGSPPLRWVKCFRQDI